MRTRLRLLIPWALALGCFFVTGLVSVALAGPGGSSGPGGGCPTATATSPGCVTTTTIANQPSYTATGAAAQWNCSGDYTCQLLSAITPGTASSTVAATSVKAPAGLDADDLAFQVLFGVGYIAKVDVEGDTQIAGDFTFSDTLTSTTDATLLISGAATDAVTSSTVGVFTMKAQANITAADLLLDVQDSAGAHAFTVTEAGQTTAYGFGATRTDVGIYVVSGAYISLNGLTQAGSFIYSPGGTTYFGVSGTIEAIQTATAFSPGAASGNALGTTALPWDDLAGDSTMRGTCTLNAGTPSTCTATVTAAAICTCSPVGTTAVIAAGGCAVSLSGTTLTLTGPAGLSHNVNYHCIL